MVTQTSAAGAERHGTWYSFDTPYERMQLFSPWSIVGFGVAVGLGLLLVFPHRTLEQRLASSELNRKPDRLTVEYLKVFLKAEPGATILRGALVEQLVRLGSFNEARESIGPLLHSRDPAARLDAQWLELKMLEQEAFAAKENSPDRAERLVLMRQQLGVLLRLPQDSAHLLVLARKALAAGDIAIAAQAFVGLAARPEMLTPEIYAEAARATLGLGDYTTGANLYFRAMEHSPALAQRRQYFLDALRTLLAGGRYGDLVKAADSHLGALAGDSQTLLFLAKMAQSANQMEAAERYARMLLRLSMHVPSVGGPLPHPYLAAWHTPADLLAALNRDGGTPVRFIRSSESGTPSMLPFDEQAYSVSFDIFLASRNLKDARRVAEEAVRQRPSNLVWRKRLAQVNDWNGAPAAALPQWLAYARLSGDESGWDTVMRLAIGLNDIATQLLVIEHKIVSDPTNPNWLNQLVQIRETAGQPDGVLNLMRDRMKAHLTQGAQRQRELEMLAGLAERSGHDNEALSVLQLLQSEFGPVTSYALRIASQLYRLGRPADAFAALEVVAAKAPSDDADFWRTYAELARLLQNDDAARRGYRRLLGAEKQSDDDLLNLVALLEAKQPLAAARLADFGFARSGNVRFALQALNLYEQLRDRVAAQAMLLRLTPAQRTALQADPNFLSLRAAIAQAGNDTAGAARDLRAALLLRPDDVALRAGLLWTLIAARDAPALSDALARWAGAAEQQRVMWDPFAAANMSLNRQDQALHWFRKSGVQRNDYLWLMAYAEALDANSQKDQAWQIRLHVWRELRRPEVLAQANPEQLGALRDRLVALSPLFMNGDGAERVIQALLRADMTQLMKPMPPVDLPRNGKEMLRQLDQSQSAAALPAAKQNARSLQELMAPGSGARPHDDARLSATARELALAYALNRNADELASVWFATRFAGQLSKPLWGELSLLLMADDRPALDRLLDDLPDWLPMYDRIEAAQRAGRPALAQTLAFDQLARLPFDQDLHERLTNLSTDQPANFSAEIARQKQSPLQTRRSTLQSGVDLMPGLKLSVTLADNAYRSLDPAQLHDLPAHDRSLEITLRHRLDNGFVAATLGQRQGLSNSRGLRLEYRLTLLPAVSMVGTLGTHQSASDSALLRVAALRDGVENTLTYAISRADYARMGLAWHRYATQAGTALGTGTNWNLEVGTHLRIEYPNLTLRLYAAGASYTDRGRIDAQLARLLPAGIDPANFRALPQNDRILGLSLGFGTVIENSYSRAWRPFAEIGYTHSQAAGSGYNLRGGIAGSVLGQDLMTLRGLRVSGTAASPQGSQEVGLDYHWFF